MEIQLSKPIGVSPGFEPMPRKMRALQSFKKNALVYENEGNDIRGALPECSTKNIGV